MIIVIGGLELRFRKSCKFGFGGYIAVIVIVMIMDILWLL